MNGDEIRIGVSTCLLGENVRYDGGHKRHHLITDVLAAHVTLVPVCPEVELGMGVPREPVRLVRDESRVRMIGTKSGRDFSADVRRYAGRRVRELGRLALDGYILKKGSPSCGMERVRTYTPAGVPAPGGRGLFAEALLSRMPLLPVEEEGRLSDPELRENFIERVFAHHRLRAALSGRWRISDLAGFHAREKLLLMAHDPAAQKRLGRLVADAKAARRQEVADGYRRGFMQALARRATRRKHVNVLQHALGYFKRQLEPADKVEFLETIESFRKGLVPLIVPITLLRHYVRRFGVETLAGQTYLEPHPKELMLRNHA
ncbi:MAG: DUF1722 domain-containing protein [Deltaproteobacteria bacterium]|nr:MAG: DUF1722 domain-containing protein [Deltaproteobacteria bacterium]